MALVVTDLQTQTQWALVAMPAPILLCACPFRPLVFVEANGWRVVPFSAQTRYQAPLCVPCASTEVGGREQPTQILTSFGTDGDGCSDDGHTYHTRHPELVSGSIYSFWLWV